MTDQSTVLDQIATALGDNQGSYERLIAGHICAALRIDPSFRGQLATPGKSARTATRGLA